MLKLTTVQFPAVQTCSLAPKRTGARELKLRVRNDDSPGATAYDERGIPGKIAPNAVLRFEVELLAIQS